MVDAWRHRLESMPLDPPLDPGGRVVILSAHPDDEVLAVGGWIATQADRELLFVTATDGEASHPGSASVTPEQLREARPRELVRSLQALGVERPAVARLGLPDGALQEHRAELADLLRPVVADADLVLAPFEADGHPDHDVLGGTAIELCRDRPVTLWRFPVWTWSWTVPDDQPWLGTVRRLACTSVARGRKRRALREFRTQVEPVGSEARDAAVVDDVLLQHALLAPEAVLT